MAQVATRSPSQANGSPYSHQQHRHNKHDSASSPRSLSDSKKGFHSRNNSFSQSPKKKNKEMNSGVAAAAALLNGSDPSSSKANGFQSTLKQRGMLHSLLSDPVRFVKSNDKQGQDYTTMGITPVNDEKYAASKQSSLMLHTTSPSINGTSTFLDSSEAGPSSRPASPTKAAKQDRDLYPYKVSLRFPGKVRPTASGLSNYGNTCYMNSVMQALVHTPPLAYALLTQDISALHGEWGGKPNANFDAVIAMQKFVKRSLQASGGTNAPQEFNRNLNAFAKPLRQGRQEDAHEYMRFLLEAMQQSCLARAPKDLKPNDPARLTTFIQKIFGGKLRSRVTCLNCSHNSDTFDPILDISLDMHKGITSLGDAFKKFIAKDTLSGSEKYKCDSCKRKVNATKQFTIESAPQALTIHLKRFSPFGSKISRQISFEDSINIAPYMSNRGNSARYRLYAVVHHYGSGPNMGHYVASVKSPSGRWTRMDDSHVSEMHRQSPAGEQSAYILFYLKERDDALESVIGANAKAGFPSSPAVSEKKRRLQPQPESVEEEDSDDDDQGPAVASSKSAKLQKLHEKQRQKQTLANTLSASSPSLPSSERDTSSKSLDKALSSKPKSAVSFYGSDEVGAPVSRDDYESLTGYSKKIAVQDVEADSDEEEDEGPTAAMSKKEKRMQKRMANQVLTAKKGVPASPFALANMGGGGHGANNKKNKKKKHGQHPGQFAGKMKPRSF